VNPIGCKAVGDVRELARPDTDRLVRIDPRGATRHEFSGHAGQGVIAMAPGFFPTLIDLPRVSVAVAIGVTVPEPKLLT
jgi:hypothetical protein